jgi:MYXO-CTERM domain-containing protein
VKPIKTPVKTVTTKNTTSKINEAQEWRPEIVLPVVFLALIALLGLGAFVARRRRRGSASIGSSNSSISPSPSDTSVDAIALHGVEI